MEKLTSKGKHTIKVENHPHTNIISKPVIIRGQEYKCRILEIRLKLRDQQLKRKKTNHNCRNKFMVASS